MILLTLAGYAAKVWLHVEAGVAIGLLVGFVVASLIPAKGGCAVRPPPGDETSV